MDNARPVSSEPKARAEMGSAGVLADGAKSKCPASDNHHRSAQISTSHDLPGSNQEASDVCWAIGWVEMVAAVNIL